jgi:hypothetical protein
MSQGPDDQPEFDVGTALAISFALLVICSLLFLAVLLLLAP